MEANFIGKPMYKIYIYYWLYFTGQLCQYVLILMFNVLSIIWYWCLSLMSGCKFIPVLLQKSRDLVHGYLQSTCYRIPLYHGRCLNPRVSNLWSGLTLTGDAVWLCVYWQMPLVILLDLCAAHWSKDRGSLESLEWKETKLRYMQQVRHNWKMECT